MPTSTTQRLLGLALVVSMAVPLFPAAAYAVPPSTEIVIDGGGWGHGIGLPQYAARGMAEDGHTYEEILAYFYNGTGLAQVDDTNGSGLPDTLRVGTHLVAGQERPFLWLDVEAEGGDVEVCLPGESPGACTFTMAPGETWRVSWDEPSEECTIDRDGTEVHASSTCGFRLEWSDQPTTRVSVPEVGRVFPRGAIEFVGPVVNNQRGFHFVAEITLEDYLYGIAEVPTTWPDEALKAQIVAARTYAAEQSRRRIAAFAANGGVRPDCSCHLRWDHYDQTYRGAAVEDGAGGAAWVAAVDATAGEVVVYPDGGTGMAETYYSSSTGGATENVWDVWGSNPTTYAYLASVPDPWSERYTAETSTIRWSKTLTAAAIAAALGMDEVVSMEIAATYESGSPSDIVVRGLDGGALVTQHLTGGQLQGALGLRSHFVYSIEGFELPERVAGADRYKTAIAAAQRSHPDGADIVYVAVGENFPDAIGAGPAAAAEDAPLLLVQDWRLPASTERELERLDPSLVVVLGGTGAISNAVVAQITAALPDATIDRRWGSNRYGTSVALTRAAFSPGVDTVFVATGESFPGALIAAPGGVLRDSPLLLTRSDRLLSAVRSEIIRLDPQRIVVVGSTIDVSILVEQELGLIAPTTRVSATDRYALGAAFSQAMHPGGAETAYIAVGDKYPDALAAGPLTAADPGPLLFVRTNELPSAVAAELERLDPSRIVILGGNGAVSGVVASLLAAYQD